MSLQQTLMKIKVQPVSELTEEQKKQRISPRISVRFNIGQKKQEMQHGNRADKVLRRFD